MAICFTVPRQNWVVVLPSEKGHGLGPILGAVGTSIASNVRPGFWASPLARVWDHVWSLGPVTGNWERELGNWEREFGIREFGTEIGPFSERARGAATGGLRFFEELELAIVSIRSF